MCCRTTFQIAGEAKATDKADSATSDPEETVESPSEQQEKSPDGVNEPSEEEPKKAAGASE
jgi:hypothetical protein